MKEVKLPFEIGSTVFYATTGPTEEIVECPDCAGTCVITMLKGNGEQVRLACGTCGSGFEGSRGYLKNTVYKSKVESVTLRSFEVTFGEKISYSNSAPGASCRTIFDADRLFATREEAEAASAKLNEKFQYEEDRRTLWNIAAKRKGAALSIAYWQRVIAKLRTDLAAAEARVQVLKVSKKLTESKETKQ